MRRGTVDNVLRIFDLADKVDREEGLKAYPMYNTTMRLFAEFFGVPLDRVVGIFSALSPINDYMGNLRSMKTVLLAVRDGREKADITVTTTHGNRDKAWRIATGETPETVIKAHKTRNFYLNIKDPDNATAVTIDRHAMSVWHGERVTDPRVPNYELVAADYRTAAARLGLLPNQVQACTWFTHKRLNGIVYNGQLDLFRVGNQWKNISHPDEIHAFPYRN